MKIKVDFQLSNQFNCLEQLIFKFVINGFVDIKQMVEILPLFSDVVIANGIKHLVNQQILLAKKEIGELTVSSPLHAIITKCHDKAFELKMPDEFASFLNNGNSILLDNYDRNSFVLKKAILSELIPEVSLGMYINSIDFVLYSKKGISNE